MTFMEIKTELPKNVIRIHGNTEDRPTEVIDLNIKTNVTVSNSNGSRFMQKLIIVFVIFFTATFTLVLFNVKRELQAMKSQEQLLETKIVILMTKSEKLNGQLNRLRSHLNGNRFYQSSTTSHVNEEQYINSASQWNKAGKHRVEMKAENELVVLKNNLTNAMRGTSNPPILYTNNQPLNSIETVEMTNDAKKMTEKMNGTNIDLDNLSNNLINVDKISNTSRFARTTSAINVNNAGGDQTDQKIITNVESHSKLGKEIDIMKSENVHKHRSWIEPRTRRIRRDDEGRGKIRAKNKGRPKRSRRRLGPLVATFIGGSPEQDITDQGTIGPWVKLNKNTSHYDLHKFHLVDNKKAIEVTMNGLYMISAQISYVGNHLSYSYWILVTSEGTSLTQKITKCSTVSSATANEVSCHTSVVLPLRRGDRVHLQQKELDRYLNLREGHSYLQLVLLSNESERRRVD